MQVWYGLFSHSVLSQKGGLRIIEYPELGRYPEGSSPTPGAAKDSLKNDIMDLSVVQMLLELWQAWCYDHFPGEPVPVPRERTYLTRTQNAKETKGTKAQMYNRKVMKA
ncbi:hypothetical protein WISP_127769 [Willisornis vidua]|uniref:Uncharacterized protein n=1 Tax=Willisornis vidua TaxID=1566151 RepID=A0ABQ9CV70_9PASS|nr:hypothetical protein WISP_127769 [Willisornis vidua]